jgi:hypothetical protein
MTFSGVAEGLHVFEVFSHDLLQNITVTKFLNVKNREFTSV